MNESDTNKTEKKIAEVYGIKSKHKTTYFYNGHKYNKLKDALNCAKLDELYAFIAHYKSIKMCISKGNSNEI